MTYANILTGTFRSRPNCFIAHVDIDGGTEIAHVKNTGRCIDGITLIRTETKYGASRFDFYVEAGGRKIFIKIKGVTLEEDGAVMFPDAPTERGLKHINELVPCVQKGYEAQIVFVIQMNNVCYFISNDKTHPES